MGCAGARLVFEARALDIRSYVPPPREPWLSVAGFAASPHGLAAHERTPSLRRQYDAWGNLEVGADQPGYAFTGREWDPETGLYYYRARYYDPKSGRFISEDPIGLVGGVNLYDYTKANPVLLVDPSGLDSFVLIVGQPGIDYNVGGNFLRAAQTRATELQAAGHTTTIVNAWNAESFNDAIVNNGDITGGVVFFGHGGADVNNDMTRGALYVGHGANDNIDVMTLARLSNRRLGPHATIELNACYSGVGGSRSIAAMMAQQLQRSVTGYTTDMGFAGASKRFSSAPGSQPPRTGPLYMVPNPAGGPVTYP